MNQELLISQFQKKDVKAYEKLYSMYVDSISGVVNNIVKDDAVTQEITQDVFIKAWNKADTYSSSKGRLFTWLLNIARNAAIDYTRSKKFKQSQQNQSVDNFVDIIQNNSSLDSLTNAIGIREFVSKLGDSCKSIIELIYFKGFTQKETSEELDIPLGTVKTRSRSCLGDLRNIIGI